MREEIYRHAGADAFLIAQQEHLFQLGEAFGANREDDFVHHMLPQNDWQIGDGQHLVGHA